ncbi:MAG: hypothetical protein Q8P57_03730 [Candidatus Pacearchaeota archaeon]|nr:hypothetical protein [Candidatus Pacearchaeota archaeon]
MVNIHKLIAAISPDIYCKPEKRKEVKEIVKKEGYIKAAEKAENFKTEVIFDYDEAKKDALSKWGLKAPIEQHEIIYDSPSEGLEPVYFWLLDFLQGPFKEVDKLIDNFVSSPGSGHFSEMQGKATQMQQEVSRNMGTINAILKTVLQIVYDLKEFKIRLEPYNFYRSGDAKKKYTGLLSLKQIWLDNVDAKKGRGSIHAMATGELDFVTLRDAFMVAESVSKIDDIDLNDRVKRILKQRIDEFLRWIDESESSLRQRFEIEKNYLKSQVNSLKLTTRWVKPYLKAAQKLEQKHDSMQAALVTTFNTILLNLVILAKSPYNPEDDVNEELLPEVFKKVKARKYYSILIVEFDFRGIPQRVPQSQHWGFGGRVNIKFTSYSLNEQEIKVLKEELEKDDMGDVMQLIQGVTDDSLDQIKKDIDDILDDKKKLAEQEEEKSKDINPFSALFSFLKFKDKKDKDKKEDLSKGIKPDNRYEEIIRSQAIISAREKCFTTFHTYKKAHGMPSHQDPFKA